MQSAVGRVQAARAARPARAARRHRRSRTSTGSGGIAFSIDPGQIKNVTIPVGGGSCLGLGGGAGGLFADFRDDGVLETPLITNGSASSSRRAVQRSAPDSDTRTGAGGRYARPDGRAATRSTRSRPTRARRPAACTERCCRSGPRGSPTWREPLHPKSPRASRRAASTQLYAHQAAGDRRAARRAQRRRRDRHRVGQVALLPGADRRRRSSTERRDTALLVFPTKALAQDQLRSLRSWLVPGLRAVTYDGDTAADDRAWARKNANVVLTNPEMLHMGILPSHKRWATFLMRLRYVVVDELHTLRGIFGSHVAHVLRRLRRLCEHYGADPDVLLRERDDRQPRRAGVARCAGCRSSRSTTTARRRPSACSRAGNDRCSTRTRARARRPTSRPPSCSLAFVRAGHQTLAFTRSRRGAELVAQHARAPARRARATRRSATASRRTAPATSPEERRELEHELTSGELLGVAATNALELGIDVGGLDAVVLNGFPGTLASMWQQAGRAGPHRSPRRPRCSSPATTSSTSGTPRIPTELHAPRARARGRQPAEPVRAARAGRVRGARAAARARRRALVRRRPRRRGARARARRPAHAARRPACTGRASDRPRRERRAAHRLVDRVPLDRRATRTASIGTVDDARVFAVAHPGAVYLHQGRQYRVERARHRATTSRCSSRTTTPTSTRRPRTETDIAIVARGRVRGRSATRSVHLGAVEVTQPGRRVPAQADLDQRRDRGRATSTCPSARSSTRACWYTVPLDVRRGGRASPPAQLLGTVHAAEHGLIGMLPLFTICDRWDVGGVSMATAPADRRADDLRLRRLPGRRRHRRARVRRRGRGTCARRSSSSPRARATTAARRACSRRSAATGTSTSTRAARSRCSGSWLVKLRSLKLSPATSRHFNVSPMSVPQRPTLRQARNLLKQSGTKFDGSTDVETVRRVDMTRPRMNTDKRCGWGWMSDSEHQQQRRLHPGARVADRLRGRFTKQSETARRIPAPTRFPALESRLCVARNGPSKRCSTRRVTRRARSTVPTRCFVRRRNAGPRNVSKLDFRRLLDDPTTSQGTCARTSPGSRQQRGRHRQVRLRRPDHRLDRANVLYQVVGKFAESTSTPRPCRTSRWATSTRSSSVGSRNYRTRQPESTSRRAR